jgi:hypothetical protein
MPLSTQRLENFRDGLDDYACVKMAESRFGRKIEVPENLVRTLSDFTDSPSDVRAWRNRIYDDLSVKR